MPDSIGLLDGGRRKTTDCLHTYSDTLSANRFETPGRRREWFRKMGA